MGGASDYTATHNWVFKPKLSVRLGLDSCSLKRVADASVLTGNTTARKCHTIFRKMLRNRSSSAVSVLLSTYQQDDRCIEGRRCAMQQVPDRHLDSATQPSFDELSRRYKVLLHATDVAARRGAAFLIFSKNSLNSCANFSISTS